MTIWAMTTRIPFLRDQKVRSHLWTTSVLFSWISIAEDRWGYAPRYLYGLTGEKRAISITIPSFAGGLSGKLISGDIVSIIAVDYKEKGETVVPEELQYVEVIAVTDKKGNDDETVTVKPDGKEETELPETLTLLVTPMQANILAELEAEGEIHVALVYRGTAENAQKFISAQEKLLEELTSEDEKK